MFSNTFRRKSTTLNQTNIHGEKTYPYILQTICSFGGPEDTLLNSWLS